MQKSYKHSRSNLASTTCLLFDFGQVLWLLRVSVAPFVKWEQYLYWSHKVAGWLNEIVKILAECLAYGKLSGMVTHVLGPELIKGWQQFRILAILLVFAVLYSSEPYIVGVNFWEFDAETSHVFLYQGEKYLQSPPAAPLPIQVSSYISLTRPGWGPRLGKQHRTVLAFLSGDEHYW